LTFFTNFLSLKLYSLGVGVSDKGTTWESPLEPDPDHAGAGKRHFCLAVSATVFPIHPLSHPCENFIKWVSGVSGAFPFKNYCSL